MPDRRSRASISGCGLRLAARAEELVDVEAVARGRSAPGRPRCGAGGRGPVLRGAPGCCARWPTTAQARCVRPARPTTRARPARCTRRRGWRESAGGGRSWRLAVSDRPTAKRSITKSRSRASGRARGECRIGRGGRRPRRGVWHVLVGSRAGEERLADRPAGSSAWPAGPCPCRCPRTSRRSGRSNARLGRPASARRMNDVQIGQRGLRSAQADGRVVVEADPDHRQQFGRQAGEPGVAQVVGGARLAGGVEREPRAADAGAPCLR